jgi:hypothetical protein
VVQEVVVLQLERVETRLPLLVLQPYLLQAVAEALQPLHHQAVLAVLEVTELLTLVVAAVDQEPQLLTVLEV